RERYDFTQRLLVKGYAQAVEVDRVRLALSQAERKHQDLVESLRVLESHQHQRTLKALEGDAATAENNLTRQESLAQLRILARQRIINSQRQRLMRQKQQFDWATRM